MPLHKFPSICERTQPIIVSKDDRQPRKHIAHNIHSDHVTHYRIDGIVITDGIRCDFLLINECTCIAYLIELKGSDLGKAAEQLLRTEEYLKTDLENYSIQYRIIASKARTHAIESTSFRKFREKKKGALKYKINQLTEDI